MQHSNDNHYGCVIFFSVYFFNIHRTNTDLQQISPKSFTTQHIEEKVNGEIELFHRLSNISEEEK